MLTCEVKMNLFYFKMYIIESNKKWEDETAIFGAFFLEISHVGCGYLRHGDLRS